MPILPEAGQKDSFFENFEDEMESIKLVGLNGIIRKVKGFKEMGKMRLEISWGLKCNKLKVGVKPANRQPNFLLLFPVMGRPSESWGSSYMAWGSLKAKPWPLIG